MVTDVWLSHTVITVILPGYISSARESKANLLAVATAAQQYYVMKIPSTSLLGKPSDRFVLLLALSPQGGIEPSVWVFACMWDDEINQTKY